MKRVRDEDGQALLLALGFLLFFGLVIAVVLSFADSSLHATVQLREQRSLTYALDGATDGAIQFYRQTIATGWPNLQANAGSSTVYTGYGTTTCPNYVDTINGITVIVTCTPELSPPDTCSGGTCSIDVDRKVKFVATGTVGIATARVVAEVIYRDSVWVTDGASGLPPVAVLSWTYCPPITTGGACT